MSLHSKRVPMVLAVAPSVRGFGFVVFKGPRRLLDWGARHVRKDKNAGSLAKLELLLSWHNPDILVVEDPDGPGSRRGRRIRRLLRSIHKRAQARRVESPSFSRGQIRDCFAPFDVKTKFEIATRIGDWLPELSLAVPPKPQPWESENPRMAIFDAASLALTYYDRKGKRSPSRAAKG